MSTPAFHMHDGHVSLDGQPVLKGLDVRVASGEVVAVLGANGSGKSTLVRALLGLVPLNRGQARIHGVPPARFRDWQRIGYVPQRSHVGGGVPATVREVVASGRVARQRRFRPATGADRRAVDAALETIGLTDRAHDPVSALSGGQQQRVLIARALAGEPDTLVLDEPTAGVDATNQQALATTLGELTGRGLTVVLVAHGLGPITPLVTRTITLSDGRVTRDVPGALADAAETAASQDGQHCHSHDHDTGAGFGQQPTLGGPS